MILFEVFKKRRKYEPILRQVWDRISPELVYPPIAETEPEQKLAFFGLVSYATVYQSALAAGMSPSAGHYLARMQLGKYKLDPLILQVVESTFSGFDSAEEQVYADFFCSRLAEVITMVTTGAGDVDALLRELAEGFRKVEFS